MLDRFLDTSIGYRINRLIGTPTANSLRTLLLENVAPSPQSRVLELGCGLGHFSEYLPADYYGIDINPEYIESAQRMFKGKFFTMDCTKLNFEDNYFDQIYSFATFHHLSPKQVGQTVSEAFRVCKNKDQVHIVDAILPLSPNSHFKRQLFLWDRGRFQRTLDQHLALLNQEARVLKHAARPGLLHDTAYTQLAPRG